MSRGVTFFNPSKSRIIPDPELNGLDKIVPEIRYTCRHCFRRYVQGGGMGWRQNLIRCECYLLFHKDCYDVHLQFCKKYIANQKTFMLKELSVHQDYNIRFEISQSSSEEEISLIDAEEELASK